MIFGVVLGFLWGTLLEWFIHQYILHELAKRGSFSFHLDHHRICSKSRGKDHEYRLWWWSKDSRIKEVVALAGLVVLHVPLLFLGLLPFFLGSAAFAVTYYTVHKKAHLDPDWGWRWTPWHMEHHMIDARRNMGIVTPVWDWVFGTLIAGRRR